MATTTTTTTCKHWVVHRHICCQCKSRVKTNDAAPMMAARSTSLLIHVCPHRMYYNGRCCRCGYSLHFYEYARPFSYITRHLRLSPEFEASTKKQKLGIGLGQKKLHLVLALEHTLIDRIKRSHIAADDSGILSRDDVFRLPNDNMLVKFRPFVREFLSGAKEFFTMHVFTKYGPDHAKKVVNLLDPHMVYFGNRIITSRDSGFCLKSLELVLANPRGVIVLDYKPRSWRNRDYPNLISPPKYDYFKENSSSSSSKVVHGVLAKALNVFKNNLKVVELEGKREECFGVDDHRIFLTVLLTRLKEVHDLFFNEGYRDVTDVLPRVFEEEY